MPKREGGDALTASTAIRTWAETGATVAYEREVCQEPRQISDSPTSTTALRQRTIMCQVRILATRFRLPAIGQSDRGKDRVELFRCRQPTNARSQDIGHDVVRLESVIQASQMS